MAAAKGETKVTRPMTKTERDNTPTCVAMTPDEIADALKKITMSPEEAAATVAPERILKFKAEVE